VGTRIGRAAVFAALVTLCTAASLVRSDPAYANYGAGLVDAIQSASDYSYVRSQLASPSGVLSPAQGTSTNVSAEWMKVRMATPGVGAGGANAALLGTAGINLPTLAVAAAGLALGWEIGHASGLSDWAYGVTSGTGTATATGISGATWVNYTCSAGVNDFTPCQTQGYATNDKIWVLRHTGDCSSTDYATTSWETAWNTTFTCTQTQNTNHLNWLQGAALTGLTTDYWVETGDCTSDGATNDCYGIFTGPTELFAGWTVTQGGTYSSTLNVGDKTSTLSSVPRPAVANIAEYGSAGADTIEETIEDNPILAPAIGELLHPGITDEPAGAAAPETAALPQPYFGETYAQYTARLRQIGFLGTITGVENDPAETAAGPLVVTQVELEADTTTTVDVLTDTWPVPAPQLTIGDSTTTDTVTINYNPDDATPPAPGDPGSAQDPPPGTAPVGVPPITVGNCTCPAPDFSPLTDLDYGETFPFGVVTMVDGLLGTTLYSSPDAPAFDFDFTSFEAGNFGPYNLGHYVVDLEVLDDYMAVIRTMIAWVIWIGGLWWFGSRWFGFKGGGDPGEAVDEAWS